jgi:hypothetical protein
MNIGTEQKQVDVPEPITIPEKFPNDAPAEPDRTPAKKEPEKVPADA